MPEDYTIEQLENTFKEHAEAFHQKELDKQNHLKEKYKEDYEKYYDDKNCFNISEALHVICREIRQLKSLTAGRRYEILDKLPID